MEWTTDDCFAIYTLLQSWTKGWTSEEQADIARQVKGMKESQQKKEERRLETIITLQSFQNVVVTAVKSLLRVGRVLPKSSSLSELQPLITTAVTWMLMSEHIGANPLRWFVSFHLKESFSYLLNMSYEDIPRVHTALLIEGLCSLFVPSWKYETSHRNLDRDLQEYAALDREDMKAYISSRLRDEDEEFRGFVLSHAQEILCFLFLHTTHSMAKVRKLCMQALCRLVSCDFGMVNDLVETAKTRELRKKLKHYANPVACQTMATCRKNACSLSALAARGSHRLTGFLFQEAFTRIPQIHDRGRRRWLLRVLLPWCGNIELKRSIAPKGNDLPDDRSVVDGNDIFLSERFLSNAFLQFTLSVSDEEGGIASESEKFWRSLAFAGNQRNLMAVIEFFVSRMVTSDRFVEYGRKIILILYQLNPSHVLPPILSPLHFLRASKILDQFQISSDAPARSNVDILLKTSLILFGDCFSELISPCCVCLHRPLHCSLVSFASNPHDIYLDSILTILDVVTSHLKAKATSGDEMFASHLGKLDVLDRCRKGKQLETRVSFG